jgi:hypothetical protein
LNAQLEHRLDRFSILFFKAAKAEEPRKAAFSRRKDWALEKTKKSGELDWLNFL